MFREGRRWEWKFPTEGVLSGEDPTMTLEKGNGFINVGLLVALIHIHFVIEVAGFGGK